jgi:hypothetical protein
MGMGKGWVRWGLIACLFAVNAFADDFPLSEQEFKMYRNYLDAMEDPRVQAMKESQRLPAIAKDRGYKVKELERVVAKGNEVGDLQAECLKRTREALSSTSLMAQVEKLDIDVSQPYAIAYVGWKNAANDKLEEEASLAALNAAKACPIVSTIRVWAQDATAEAETPVFEATISKEAAAKINAERVNDFADTRYIRLFEQVKK